MGKAFQAEGTAGAKAWRWEMVIVMRTYNPHPRSPSSVPGTCLPQLRAPNVPTGSYF